MVQDMFFEVSPFIVRDSETKELVGVFWADNRQALFDTVDEFVDPQFCEFRNIGKSGGIKFEQMEEETAKEERGIPIPWILSWQRI